MEPPAATSCSSHVGGLGTNGCRSEKTRRSATDFLQIDPSSTFIANSTHQMEELPENFLETISPQQTNQPFHETNASSPQLAPLAPMSIGTEQSGSYSSMLNMSSQYGSEGLSSLRHNDKSSFGNGPACLLSPLNVDSRRQSLANEYSRNVYIKEETDLDNVHHYSNNQMMGSAQQNELDRNAETPPAVSNVELATTMIASLIGDQGESYPSHGYSSTPSSSMMVQQRLSAIKTDEDSLDGGSSQAHQNGDHDGQQQVFQPQYNMQKEEEEVESSGENNLTPTKGPTPAKRVYSTKDTSDPLNAEIDDDIYIDTKELCKRIAYELKQHSIPQAIFAERILCRSQGTLSDLLRNPKPWNKLKSGRETFRRMYNWVQQPLESRLAILDMLNKEGGTGGENGSVGLIGGPKLGCGMSPPTPAQNVRHHTRHRHLGGGSQLEGEPANKRPRLVFTDIQKRTLQAIFKETQRPSREMQQTIAEHLRLDLSTVANFFMNARRRSRIGPNTNDEPAPYQQVRPITPPPEESPPRPNQPRQRPANRQPANMQLIEDTVCGVAEQAMEYSRRLDEEAAATSLQNLHNMGADDYKEIVKMDPMDQPASSMDALDESISAVAGVVEHDPQVPVVKYTVPDVDADDQAQLSLLHDQNDEEDLQDVIKTETPTSEGGGAMTLAQVLGGPAAPSIQNHLAQQ